jgi:hypothetical protein
MDQPKVITLCGSSRFVDIMAVVAWILERDEGAIVMGLHLLPWWYSPDLPADHLAEHENVASKMDELHLRKIDRSQEIIVIDENNYIGDSTRREIEYAKNTGKAVKYLSQMDKLQKEIYECMLKSAEEKEQDFSVKVKIPPTEGVGRFCSIECPLYPGARTINYKFKCKLYLHDKKHEGIDLMAPGPDCPRYKGKVYDNEK